MLWDTANPPPDSDGHDIITTLSEEVALAQAAEFCSLTSVKYLRNCWDAIP